VRNRICIAGWFGSDNYGDELLLHSLMTEVKRSLPDVELSVICADPGRVTDLHKVDAVGLPVIRRRKDDAPYAGAIVRQRLSESRILILGPGTVFQERSPSLPWPGTWPLFTRLTMMARMSGARVAIVGAGIREGNTAFGNACARFVGGLSDSIGVRDAFSARAFGSKAEVIGDVAAALPGVAVTWASNSSQFAVSMRPLSASDEQRLAHTISELIRFLASRGLAGTFLPMAVGRNASRENDLEVYQKYFAESLDLANFPLSLGPVSDNLSDWTRSLRNNRLVIATRLHAALLAVSQAVPTVAFAYERKLSVVFEQLGLGAFILPVTASPAQAEAVCERALQGQEPFQRAQEIIFSQGDSIRRFITSTVGRSL
jgi:polysaccharide pyruvyl transferase WcaK-like protein